MSRGHRRWTPLAAALAALLLLAPTGAIAQYRPPPMTEAQRLSSSADQPRVEGSRLLASGDKKGAEVQFKKALGLYEQALKADPNLVVAAEGLGVVGNALGLYDKVIGHLQPVADSQPDALDIAFNLGVAYFKSRRFNQAVPYLEKVRVGNDKAHLIAHYYLAQYHLATQRGELAQEALQSYLLLRPDSVASDDHEIHALLGKAYVLQRKTAQARASYELAQKGRPESAPIQIGLAAVLELEGKNSEAITKLEGISQRFPKSVEAKDKLARLLLAAGRGPQAETVANQLLALSPGATSHLLLADIYLAQKRAPDAEAQARKALAASPGMLLAQVRLGAALQAQNKHDEAVAILEQAVAGSNGQSFDALAALGSAHRRAGRFQKAIDAHQRGLKLAPQYPQSHLLLAADYFAAGNWDRAILHYEQVLQLVPNDRRGTHFLALSYARRGKSRAGNPAQLDDAVRDLRRAFDLEPSGVLARNLGAGLIDQKRFEDAETVLSAGVTLPDADWQNSLLLGYAQLGANKADVALTTLEGASSSAPDDDTRALVQGARGLALAETGKLDEAITLLERARGVKAGVELASRNLPVVLYRRALNRLSRGDAAGAREDLTGADKITSEHSVRTPLAALARAMLDVEEGKDVEAAAKLKTAKVEQARFLVPGAGNVLGAYLHYRAGRFPQARKQTTASLKASGPASRSAQALNRAINREEAERSYARRDLKAAEAAMKLALKAEPNSPALAVNMACVQYAKKGAKGAKDAAAIWTRHAEGVPEATLNLGILALERDGNVSRAVDHFDTYAKKGGARASLARDWVERLRALHGGGAAVAGEGGGL